MATRRDSALALSTSGGSVHAIIIVIIVIVGTASLKLVDVNGPSEHVGEHYDLGPAAPLRRLPHVGQILFGAHVELSATRMLED
jgi:hypothetical protein